MAADPTPESTFDNTPNYQTLNITVQGISLAISAIHNQHHNPRKPTVLFLHGFGGTKEDYADFLNHPTLSQNFSLLAYDSPGCGQTECTTSTNSDNDDEQHHLLHGTLSIPFLAQTALAVLIHLNINQIHLIGHSMGGLTALLLSHNLHSTSSNTKTPQILSFLNIKGNLSPEDCFLSRQVFAYPSSDPNLFFNDFIHRTARSKSLGSALYASSLRHKVRPPQGTITSAIFRSMVELSDNEDLLGWFLVLKRRENVRCMFMYGEENKGLSYLPRLKGEGVELAMVEHSGHFVMYSNPPVMWRYIEEFLDVK